MCCWVDCFVSACPKTLHKTDVWWQQAVSNEIIRHWLYDIDLSAFVRLKIACYLQRQQPVARFILKLSFRFYCLPEEFQLPSERNIQQAVFLLQYIGCRYETVFLVLSLVTHRGGTFTQAWKFHGRNRCCIMTEQKYIWVISFSHLCLVLSGSDSDGSNKVMLAVL